MRLKPLHLIPAFLMLSKISFAAFYFGPVYVMLSPTGSGTVQNFDLVNTSQTKLPIQISIVNRDPDINGEEKYQETDDIENLFTISESMLVLKPGERKTVQVTWIGDKNPKKELPFRIIAEELPFKVDEVNKTYTKPVGRIGFATKYIGSLYITPSFAKPKLIFEASTSSDAKPELVLDITNEGLAHQMLSNSKFKIESIQTKQFVVLQGANLAGIGNETVLGGKKRRFKLPWPQQLPLGPVKVSVEFASE